MGKINHIYDHRLYQMAKNITNGRKLLQTVLKYTNIYYLFKGPPKCTQIWNFGMKVNHPVTLKVTRLGDVSPNG
jgi:hypothetical protein